MSTVKEGRSHGPMPVERAPHLLNPLRALILSPRALTKRLDLKKNSQVLEVGPGPGYFSPEVARRIPEGKLVLADIQQEMLDMSRKRLEKEGISNVQYVRGRCRFFTTTRRIFRCGISGRSFRRSAGQRAVLA